MIYHDHGLAPRARHRCNAGVGHHRRRRTQRFVGPDPHDGRLHPMAVVEGEPTSVDPAFDYDFVSGLATSSITEPLLVFCEHDTKLCPNLATSWTVSPDGLTYTLKIRQGVKFHDGTTMTVDDVVYSLDRIRDPKLGSYVGLDARQRGRRHRARCRDRGHHHEQAGCAPGVRPCVHRRPCRQQGIRGG